MSRSRRTTGTGALSHSGEAVSSIGAAATVDRVGDLSLVELMLQLATVQYERRARARARQPATTLALVERDLLVELRRRGPDRQDRA